MFLCLKRLFCSTKIDLPSFIKNQTVFTSEREPVSFWHFSFSSSDVSPPEFGYIETLDQSVLEKPAKRLKTFVFKLHVVF